MSLKKQELTRCWIVACLCSISLFSMAESITSWSSWKSHRQTTCFSMRCSCCRERTLTNTVSPKKKKKVQTCRTAFSFDYGTHLLQHNFTELIQCHSFYIHQDLDEDRIRALCKVFVSKSQIFPRGEGVCTPAHVWKLCLPEPLFHRLNPINPSIVIYKYFHAITEEETQLHLFLTTGCLPTLVKEWEAAHSISWNSINHCNTSFNERLYFLSYIQVVTLLGFFLQEVQTVVQCTL